MEKKKSILDRAFCLAIVFFLLSTNFSIAFAQTGPEATPTAPTSPAPSTSSFSCSNEKLSDSERQKLWDETLNKGFVGRELNAGTLPNPARDKLDNNVLVTPDAENELAIKQEVPALKIKPEEISHLLNNYSTGSFAFGLEINDSLRAGRCREIDGNCALLGEQLKLRNSGTGIVTDVKNVFKDLYSLYGLDDAVETSKDAGNSILTSIRGELVDANETDQNIQAQIARRIKGNIMPNSILTDSFYSSMNSNCTTSECVISSYSMFDKLYNSYFSTEMLFSNFGPTLVGKTKQMFRWTRARWGSEPGGNLSVSIAGKKIPLSLKETKFYKRLKGSLYHPGSFLTSRKGTKMQSLIDKYALDTEAALKANYMVIQGGTFNANVTKIVDRITKDAGEDPERRRAVYLFLKELRDYAEAANLARESAAARTGYDVAFKTMDHTSEAFKKIKRDYAGEMGKIWDWVDDTSGIDVPEWFANHKSVKWNKYAVKTQTGDFIQPAVDSHYTDRILKKFAATGDFSYTPADMKDMKAILDNTNGKLNLYQVMPQGKKMSEIGRDSLEEVITKGHIQDAFAQLDDGTFVPFNKENMNYIIQHTQGEVNLYRGGWEKARELSGDELSDIILGPRAEGRIATFQKNTERMLQVATEKGFYTRERAASLLDKAMVNDRQIIKSYLSPKGGVKWTVYPYMYWGAKRGFGNDQLSAYMLPDTWTSINIKLGEQGIYNSAYIDFFSNEGSDQGDVFNQFLNNLPWKMGYDTVSNLYKPLRDALDKFTKNEIRSTVGNLAVYTSGSDDCQACTITLDSKDMESFSPFFFAPQRMDTFIFEDTPAKEKKVGQTLIAYASHTDIMGKSVDIQRGAGVDEADYNGGIVLSQAMKDKQTCNDKVSELSLGGIPIGKFYQSLGLKGASVGGALALTETITYATIWWAGIIGSVLQQALIAPQLQDCVDTEEGYYIHFFAPAKSVDEKKKSQTNPANLSTEKVSEMISKGKDTVAGMFSGNPDSWTKEANDGAKKAVNELVNNAKENDIVEALLRTEGYSSGQFKGTDLFYLWVQGGSELNPTSYRTEGKSVVNDSNTNTKVEIDFKTGTVFVNGKPVITNPDISRLYSINTAIPAGEFPNTITKVALPVDSNDLMFQMSIDGQLFVSENSVLDCIKNGVLEQTGVPLNSNDLTEVFGKVNSVVTDSHPNIYPDLTGKRIIAEGMPRKIAQGSDARVDILANRETLLQGSLDNAPYVGKMKSIQFRNGFILFKPETNELIIWLKHNEKAILTQNDVAGLLAKKATSTNPETGCEEPAIDLEAKGFPDSELSMSKVALFNQSLKKMGPFQIFDTPTKRFVFYSKLEEGKCVPYFKVIDKKTGEVLVDQPIDSIEQTPDGVRVNTADGKSHDLGFNVEDGRPIITYNGVPELLQSAQGPNGAFWYDPNKGQWYAENAQLLPLLEAFKNKGILTQANPNGSVTSVPGGNPLNINIGQTGDSGFNLPSLPENPLLLLLYLSLIAAAIVFVRTRYNEKGSE